MKLTLRSFEYENRKVSIIYTLNINGSQLAKLKKSIPDMSLPWNVYKDEAVGLKSCKYTWKITIYVNMWNFG